jgi:CrcB protein
VIGFMPGDGSTSTSVPDDAARVRPHAVAAVAAGGALGAPARYGVAQLVDVEAGTFPWATFAVNVSGSLALGFLLVVIVRRYPPDRHAQPFLATGFLGAYTTFSTFVVEIDLLIRDGRAALAVTYVLASVLVGLAAAWAGMALARRTTIGGPDGLPDPADVGDAGAPATQAT